MSRRHRCCCSCCSSVVVVVDVSRTILLLLFVLVQSLLLLRNDVDSVFEPIGVVLPVVPVHSFAIITSTTGSIPSIQSIRRSKASTTTTTATSTATRMMRASASASASRTMMMKSTTTNHDNIDTAMKQKKKGSIIVVGASGYIGKAVVRECLRQNYLTFAFVRSSSSSTTGSTSSSTSSSSTSQDNNNMLPVFTYQNQSAISIICDVTNATQVYEQMQYVQQTYLTQQPSDHDDNVTTATSTTPQTITAVISCLASRSGIKSDAYNIDYQATYNCLQSAIQTHTKHFILLSAFCVQKPILQFQQAKLKLEAALQEEGNNGNILYTIVRPTAFFKSVSGQLEVVQSGAPFVLFDKGPNTKITACNPIAESDLATYMVDSIITPQRHNQIINLGGPDEPISMLQQGHMLFNATQKEPKFAYAPVWIFDIVINALQFVADVFQNEKIADMAETGRIGKYYAVEDMVTTLPTEKYGTITLQEHYNRIAIEGNDYDPYTTMFARARGIDVTAIQNEMKNTNNINVTTITTNVEEMNEITTTTVR